MFQRSTLLLVCALAASAPAWAMTGPPISLAPDPVAAAAQDPPTAKLAPPLPGAPITSGYGWREHPIFNMRRFHQGVDFSAPLGTPVHAADDGVIEQISRRRDYGLYLRIRHSGRVETGYAHLARLARGLRVGSRVQRGQVVAGVGRSGWATGPHLFYEVFVDGNRVDPQGAAIPVATANIKAGGSGRGMSQ